MSFSLLYCVFSWIFPETVLKCILFFKFSKDKHADLIIHAKVDDVVRSVLSHLHIECDEYIEPVVNLHSINGPPEKLLRVRQRRKSTQNEYDNGIGKKRKYNKSTTKKSSSEEDLKTLLDIKTKQSSSAEIEDLKNILDYNKTEIFHEEFKPNVVEEIRSNGGQQEITIVWKSLSAIRIENKNGKDL